VTQDECLVSPHHFTHLGVCYPGSVAWIGLSSPDNPQPVTFSVTSVPEPSTAALFAIALVVGAALHGLARLGHRPFTVPLQRLLAVNIQRCPAPIHASAARTLVA
jgi:hypothetical protein